MIINVSIAGKTYIVKIEDLGARPVKAEVDGETFEVWPEEAAAAPALSAPAAPAAAAKPVQAPAAPGGRDVNSPLPGVIIEINAKAGAEVKSGDPLLVLEAMKMKNTIRANREGRIKKIHAAISDQVQHSAVLMEFED